MKKQVSRAKRPAATPAASARVPRPPQKIAQKLTPVAAAKPPYWHRNAWHVAGFLAAVAAFAACAWLVHKHQLAGKDQHIFRLINDWPEKLRAGFVAVTALGSFWAAAVLVAAAFVLRLYQLVWRLALSIFTAYGLLVVLKDFFARARPDAALVDVHVRTIEGSFAFPSAHAALAAVLALTIRTYLPIPAVWQWVVVVLWIGGVGLSRVYLGVHTPLDVAAGVALGAGVVCFWRVLPLPVKRLLHLQ